MTESVEESKAWFESWWFVGLVLCAVVALASYSGLGSDFVNHDDPDVIVNNSELEDIGLSEVTSLLTEVRDHAYLPLYYVAYLPEALIAGKDPFAFHLASILWHGLNTLLLFGLLRWWLRRFDWALIAALIFAAHPIAVESVAWASGRKDQVSLAFLLIGLQLFGRGLESAHKGKVFGACALLFFGCFAKGTIVVFPLLLVALWWWLRSQDRVDRPILAKSGLVAAFLLAAGATAVHLMVAQSEGTAGAGATHGAGQGGLLFLESLGLYAQHLFVPIGLSVHYHFPLPDGFSMSHVTGGLVLLVLAFCVLMFWRKPKVIGALCGVWILASLLPFNNIFPRTAVPMADRYLAVALPAFALFIASLIGRLGGAIKWGACVALVAVLVLLSQARTLEFRDSETLFRAAIKADGADPLPPAQVAEALLEKSLQTEDPKPVIEEALALFGRSVALAEQANDPVRTLRARLRYADTLLRNGRGEKAQLQFAKCIATFDANPDRYAGLGVDRLILEHNLATCLLQQGLEHDAKASLLQILDKEPTHPESRLTLASLSIRQGLSTYANAHGEKDLSIRAQHLANRGLADLERLRDEMAASVRGKGPFSKERGASLEPRILREFGESLLACPWRKNSTIEALKVAESMIRRYPKQAEGYVLRARVQERVLEGSERAVAVLEDLERALQCDPKNIGIILRMSRWLRQAGENSRARVLLAAAMARAPKDARVKEELSWFWMAQAQHLRTSNQLDKALAAARRSRELEPKRADAWLMEAQLQESSKQWEKAESAYREVIKLNPEAKEARLGLARFHQARGFTTLSEVTLRVARKTKAKKLTAEQAEALRQELRDIAATDYRLALRWGGGAEDVTIARRYLQTLRDERHAAATKLREKGMKEFRSGNIPEAISLFQSATRTNGTDREAWWLLAEALRQRSMDESRSDGQRKADRAEALAAVEQSLLMDPEYLQALYLASDLYYVKGDWSKLREVGRLFLDLAKEVTALANEKSQVRRRMASIPKQ